MLQKLRLALIKKVIDINEYLIFERKLKKFYKQYEKIDTVFDVGANKGQSINFFLAINPNCKIYAFEPNPALYRLLQKKYSQNKNIKLFNIGISESKDEKLFYENIFDYTSTFEEINYDSKYLINKARALGVDKSEIVKEKYFVKTDTLHNFIQTKNISKIDILKIDTEGHEYACLKGLFGKQSIGKSINIIQLEDHNDDMYANRIEFPKINKLLNENNFYGIYKVKHGFGNFDEVIYKYQDEA